MSEQKGIFSKYYISKADGSPIDPDAKYIVLRYDANSNDGIFAIHALIAYAKAIKYRNPQFAEDLLKEIEAEFLKTLLLDTAN